MYILWSIPSDRFALCVLGQLVLDSHRWVPLPAVGFSGVTAGEDSLEDVTPPSYLMEHPPLAVFINGKVIGIIYSRSKSIG